LRLIIFDCDGTLVDSQHLIHTAMVDTFANAGLEAPERDAVRRIVGLSLPLAMARLLPPEVADEPRIIAALVEGYRDAFGALRAGGEHEEPMYEGARETLDALFAMPDVLMAIATGKSQRGVRHLVEREGLHGYFAAIQTADDAPSKPHPAMIEQAIADAGVAPDRAIMVGDTTFDIEMAVNAGVPGLGVAWGYHPPEALTQAGAVQILGSFDDFHEAFTAHVPQQVTPAS